MYILMIAISVGFNGIRNWLVAQITCLLRLSSRVACYPMGFGANLASLIYPQEFCYIFECSTCTTCSICLICTILKLTNSKRTHELNWKSHESMCTTILCTCSIVHITCINVQHVQHVQYVPFFFAHPAYFWCLTEKDVHSSRGK